MKKLITILLLVTTVSFGQILTFEFSSLSGNEVSASSNSNDANLVSSSITRGAGLTASSNGGRFNATNWALTSIANAVSGDDYMEFTITPQSGYQFSVNSIYIQMQRSSTGPSAIALRSSVDAYASNLDQEYSITDNTSTQNFTFTFAQSNSSSAVTYRVYMYAESTGGSGGIGDGSGDDIIVSGTVSPTVVNPPTKLIISSVNSGSSPSVLEPFDLTVNSVDNSDVAQNVAANTDVTLSITTGSGTIGGTVTGIIPAGSNSVSISGITYNTAEGGVSIKAKRTSGDALSDGISDTFTVLEAASKLVLVGVPSTGQANLSLNSFTVEAQRSDNSVDLNFTSDITMAKASGAGNISGTLTQAATAGVSTFSDSQFDAGGTYTISASSTGLTGATSGSIVVISSTLPLVEDFDYTAATTLASNGWVPNSGVGTNSITLSSGSLTYTGYVSSGVGNKISLVNTGEDAFRTFDQVTSGSVYVAFMVNISVASTTGDYFLTLSTNPQGTYSDRIYAKDDGSGNLEFGIAKASNTVWTVGTYAYNTTHLIVVKYTFNAATSDDITGIYVDPTIPSAEPGSFDAQAATSEADANGIGSVVLRQGSSSVAPTLDLDGIRVATTWDATPLPVELSSFSAKTTENTVELKWNTSTEKNNYGFEIERSVVSKQLSASSTAANWKKIGFVKGSGNSNSVKNYFFSDNSVSSGKYSYRLKQIDNDGTYEYSKLWK